MPTAIDYLTAPDKHPPLPVCVLYGDEPFFFKEVLAQLEQRILSGEDAEFSRSSFNGEKHAGQPLEWRTVRDELDTVALFGGGRRLIVVDNADDFVSRHREQLENYVAKAAASSVLVLTVKSWPSNTRLAKAVAASGLPIECKAPGEAQLPRWLNQRAEKQHGAKLDEDAAEQLLEIIGPEMGRLDQELEKLALIALMDAKTAGGEKSTPVIKRQLVVDAVGGWRAKTAWDLSEKMNSGEAAVALAQLARLVESGEEPIALLAQVSSSLRKYAAATAVADAATAEKRRIDLKTILTEAGMKLWPAALQSAESHLKQLTRRRGRQILAWLLEADLALKGSNSSGHRARLVLEHLIVKLSKPTVAIEIVER
ncbi:MAG: DNA polymerase III subunit delta [Pirellulales bacterium]